MKVLQGERDVLGQMSGANVPAELRVFVQERTVFDQADVADDEFGDRNLYDL